MTRVLNDPTTFARDHLRGFAHLHADLLTAVPGGVVRADAPPAATVAVVTGGGSGHYPAFCGWVGPGLADGAVVGDVFASPSAEQVVRVARAADTGGGVLLVYGNYAGDVLNFTEALDRLAAEGVAVRQLAVTDDVTSAGPDERERRRGTAGDLVVLKVAGAAAAAGHDLDRVTALAERANARTASFGIAFSGCTLPGADAPLFDLPDGLMGVGMGVHGEPGIAEQPVARAADLARLLVDRLLAERPADASDRVAVLLNGLGATKYEELFLLWGEVAALLEAAGLTLVAPEVGELITSLDMAGLSLTVCWLDAELEELWRAPATSPAFRRGAVHAGPARRTAAATPAPVAETAPVTPRAPEVVAVSRLVAGAAGDVRDALAAAEQHLGDLDAVAGDGDHGRGMSRGASAAHEAAARAAALGAGPATVLQEAGAAWADRSGGTSGALWGAALRAAAGALPDDAVPDASAVVAAVTAARDALVRTGGAAVGDKTMLDAIEPFVTVLAEGVADGAPVREAWTRAAREAQTAAEATAQLTPLRGRARPLAARSLGHPDPGAVSAALVLTTLGGAGTGGGPA
ncbi:dihydroxyacetone kinase family protein [Cellulomonas sp. C5510]|uniref:dihydroxyacetone kinase family protein n=1 Tax=Cellulomonas sp. C5510 TaxID=2871170 RepID=UPI001C942EEF|nr:dihydroxyacetone kinase family protein [Cellulomonas sp. C5510]QZN86434.1 dihydroxyacetone kinase family protein [Cellulomonas sp. C5510]